MNEIDENVFIVLEISKYKINFRHGRESKSNMDFGLGRGRTAAIEAKHRMGLAAARSPGIHIVCFFHFNS